MCLTHVLTNLSTDQLNRLLPFNEMSNEGVWWQVLGEGLDMGNGHYTTIQSFHLAVDMQFEIPYFLENMYWDNISPLKQSASDDLIKTELRTTRGSHRGRGLGLYLTVSCYMGGLGSNPGEDMDVCKCIVPSRHGGTLNSRRVASPLVWFVEGEESWEASDHPRVFSV
ncbi:uncharacterized protein TNCV_4253371 [Trichonephila clavipes]|nr:uncharacterized protein TNCV_4253371 [Trichonephila clavipes]